MLEPQNGKLPFRRGMEVSDTLESHSYGKFRGKGFTHMLEPHNRSEPFPKDNRKLESRNQQEVVTSDAVQSGSFSQKMKLSFVNKGHEPLEISEKTTTTIQEYKHFLPPPYVTPSKAIREAVNFETKDASIHAGSVTLQVDAAIHLRPKPDSSCDATRGHFDSSKSKGKPPKASRHGEFSASKHAGLHEKVIGTQLDAVDHIRSKSGQMSLHAMSQFDHHGYENKANERGRAVNREDGEDCSSDHGDLSSIILPKPRSIRRRRSTRSSSNDSRHVEGSGKCYEKRTVTITSNRRRQRESKSIKQHALVETDIPKKHEEDKILDSLLIHYSTKPSNEVSPAMKKSGEMPATAPFPPRSISLPREQPVPSQPLKVFTRAATFQLDRSALHVHPKLPDYDDLAARFSAMKGNS
uniref:Uncharacterized protein n=1 Tax=Kalanchoe fedtschenkoi TaxID=63787 RepID=A0A7N0TBU2_KALFE